MPKGQFTNSIERSKKISEKMSGRKITWKEKLKESHKGRHSRVRTSNGNYKNYGTLHSSLNLWYGEKIKCEFCGKENDKKGCLDWANITGIYKIERENWKVLCNRCHSKFDKWVVVVLSGGMDSTTLLYWIKSQKYHIEAVSFDYGQRHKKELDFAVLTCKKLGINHKVIDTTFLLPLMQGSALTSNIDVPHGHYEDENMKQTVVPNRNMILSSMAVAYAVSIGAGKVYVGVHSGDHAIYPDCRPEFVKALNETTKIANYIPVSIQTPFINIDKADIAKIGRILKVDYSLSWTCYEGKDIPCGKCGSCQERAYAFEKAGMPDPLLVTNINK